MPKESSSIVVFITSPVSSFKGAMVTEIVEKRDALVSEEASWLGVLVFYLAKRLLSGSQDKIQPPAQSSSCGVDAE